MTMLQFIKLRLRKCIYLKTFFVISFSEGSRKQEIRGCGGISYARTPYNMFGQRVQFNCTFLLLMRHQAGKRHCKNLNCWYFCLVCILVHLKQDDASLKITFQQDISAFRSIILEYKFKKSTQVHQQIFFLLQKQYCLIYVHLFIFLKSYIKFIFVLFQVQKLGTQQKLGTSFGKILYFKCEKQDVSHLKIQNGCHFLTSYCCLFTPVCV